MCDNFIIIIINIKQKMLLFVSFSPPSLAMDQPSSLQIYHILSCQHHQLHHSFSLSLSDSIRNTTRSSLISLPLRSVPFFCSLSSPSRRSKSHCSHCWTLPKSLSKSFRFVLLSYFIWSNRSPPPPVFNFIILQFTSSWISRTTVFPNLFFKIIVLFLKKT